MNLEIFSVPIAFRSPEWLVRRQLWAGQGGQGGQGVNVKPFASRSHSIRFPAWLPGAAQKVGRLKP
jgi:hypothetical protein